MIQFIVVQGGKLYATFLFIKLLIDIVLCLIRAMQFSKITDVSIHFGKALIAVILDLIRVPILTSIYKTTNSENKNTDENRERTMQVPKTENTIIREQVTQSPPYDNNRMQVLTRENKSVSPHLNDENNQKQKQS